MKKHFYSHLVETSSLSLAIGELEISSDERTHLISLIHANLHAAVIDVVLSELGKEDKRTFLQLLSQNNHEQIWGLLSGKIDHVEDKIRGVTEQLKKEFHHDIQKSIKKI